MCVICRKPKKARLPDAKTILDMWSSNPHGAGIMWREERMTRYVKGFMDVEKFMKFIDRNRDMLERTECAMHFRIATHGGVNPENTHPFPMGGGLKTNSTNGATRFCMMHNGVLPIKPRSEKLSDTAELSLRAKSYGNPMEYLSMIAEFVKDDNRIVAFSPDKTMLIGDWTEIDGCQYSNTHFYELSYYGGHWNRNSDVVKYDYWYDRKRNEWKDALGHVVDVSWVDPYAISEEDQETYWDSMMYEEEKKFAM